MALKRSNSLYITMYDCKYVFYSLGLAMTSSETSTTILNPMPHIPFVGRLLLQEYGVLVLSFLIIAAEGFVRYATLLLPKSLVNWFHDRSRSLFHTYVRSPRPRTPESVWADKIRLASTFTELCALYHYAAESHVVQTKDGYLLGLHRIPAKRYQPVPHPKAQPHRKVVYLHHGLLMNSEVWVCIT